MKKDSIETTKEFELAMETIQPVLDRDFPEDKWYMGTCHRYWARKKELLAQKGISWKTPGELNPNVKFD